MKVDMIENIVKQVVKDLQQEGITLDISAYEYGIFDTMEAAIMLVKLHKGNYYHILYKSVILL